jgi:ribonucleoside-diphosphate reductase alpha chain
LWCPDLFFKRIQENGTWTLFSPSDVPDLHNLYGQAFETAYINYENNKAIPKKIIKVKELWDEILESLLGKGFGHPWITFKDACNVRNPEKATGIIKSTNLCTEVMLPSNEKEVGTCNLTYINLNNHILESRQALDWNKFKETIKTSIRMLDNVIDVNFYTIPETKYANQMRRPVGLGLMGTQDLFQILGLPFESDEAKELTDRIFEFLSYYAIEASTELAEERGIYQTFEDSLWAKGILTQDTQKIYEKERNLKINVTYKETLDWDSLREKVKLGMRNSQVLMMGPTRSTSYIAGSSPSIEPLDNNIFTESGMLGKYTMINQHLVAKLQELGLWNKDMLDLIQLKNGSIQEILSIPKQVRELFKTAWEIHPKHLIAHNALRSKWVDMGISFNQWLPANNIRDAERLYLECWKAGLKSTYYLHSKGTDTSTKREATDMTAKMCSLLNPDACEACQ